jgi:excisionase family DNA binding protein
MNYVAHEFLNSKRPSSCDRNVPVAKEGERMLGQLMSVHEVAEFLGVSVHTVYAWAAKGRLPVVKLGTRTMFEPHEIERWVGEHAVRERTQLPKRISEQCAITGPGRDGLEAES